MDNSLPRRVAVPPAVLVQVLDGEAVLLNLDGERYYSLDDVGTRMWSLLVDNGDVAAAMDVLVMEYDVDEATLQSDMAEFISGLAAAGLLVVDPE